LEDVINWSKTQEFYKEKFFLAGHSLGSMSIFHYATENPEKIS
jgi:pimeloyl-ACP methyl ester carboxylesterase